MADFNLGLSAPRPLEMPEKVELISFVVRGPSGDTVRWRLEGGGHRWNPPQASNMHDLMTWLMKNDYTAIPETTPAAFRCK